MNIKVRLGAMVLGQYMVWGCYLISLGNFLSHAGMAQYIGWFYAVQCVVSLFMPAAAGYAADRWSGARSMLGICNVMVGAFMGLAGWYAVTAAKVEFGVLFPLFAMGTAAFMPTISLSNTVIFKSLRDAGINADAAFPRIRLFGTLGFICGMLTVNFAGLQSSGYQLVVASALAMCVAGYSLTLPRCEASGGPSLWVKALLMLRSRETGVFFMFCILIGVALQVTNSYGNVYISQFGSLPGFASTWGAANANAIISVSQVSEAACMFLLPFFLRRLGVRKVILIAVIAWSVRFLLLSLGDTGHGLWLLIASGLVYGVAFDFFNIAGNVYVDRHADASVRASAQGLFMAMSSGIGGTIGLMAAQKIANTLVFSQPTPETRYGGWVDFWLIFAVYALVIALLFYIWMKCSSGSGASKLSKNRSSSSSVTR